MQANVQPYLDVVKEFHVLRASGSCFVAQRNGRVQFGVFTMDFSPTGTVCETLDTFTNQQEAEEYFEAADLLFIEQKWHGKTLPAADDRPFTVTEVGALVGRYRAIQEEMTDLAADVQEGGRFNDKRHAELSEEYGAIESALRVLSPDFVPAYDF